MNRLLTAIADRTPARVRRAVRVRWHSFLMLLPTAARLPAVQVGLRGWVPCWALRLVAVAVALASATLVITGPFGWTVVGVLCAVILIRPAPMAPIFAAVIGFSMLQAGDQRPWGLLDALLLLGVHACVALCLLLGATSWAARVRLNVLGRPAPRFVVIQLIAQFAGILGAVLAGRDLSLPWVLAVAGLALVALGLVWLPMLGPREEPAPSPIVRVFDATARRWGDE
jgi:hypothetical protein